MAEYVITEREYRAAMRIAYEAGAAGREVYTARDYLTRPLVRCRDCKYNDFGECEHPRFHAEFTHWDYSTTEFVPLADDPEGYCAWGERREVDGE